MEGEGISERERLQIQQIRELDAEELEVEEVDEESSDVDYHGSDGVSVAGEFKYDTTLVALHSYLGDVEDTHNRLAFLDDGATLTLPLFYLEGVVLFPEATLPLRVISPNLIAGVERAMRQVDAPYTIGVVHIYRDFNNGRIRFSTTGTTAEIRQYRRLEDGSVNVVARGQQRFRLRRQWIDVEGAPCGEVHIIQEDLPLRTPREAVGKLVPLRNSQGSFEGELSSAERRLHQAALIACHSLDSHDESMNSADEKLGRGYLLENCTRPMHSEASSGVVKSSLPAVQPYNNVRWGKYSICNLRDAPGAFWPSWVYQMYDSYSLAKRVAERWKQVVKAPSMDSFVNKPDLLSFHIASKIPASESTRQELLEIGGTSYRLRREIELLEGFDTLRCKTCQALVAKRSDILVMSSDGPLSAYANPHGFVHEVMTLFKTKGIAVTGPAVREYSWFPGYAWSMAECTMCGMHMGWYFSATHRRMRPQAFWGIRSSQIVDDTNAV